MVKYVVAWPKIVLIHRVRCNRIEENPDEEAEFKRLVFELNIIDCRLNDMFYLYFIVVMLETGTLPDRSTVFVRIGFLRSFGQQKRFRYVSSALTKLQWQRRQFKIVCAKKSNIILHTGTLATTTQHDRSDRHRSNTCGGPSTRTCSEIACSKRRAIVDRTTAILFVFD